MVIGRRRPCGKSGQRIANWLSWTPRVGLVLVTERRAEPPPASLVVAVGQDKEPLAYLGRPDLLRGEHVPFRIEPAAGQVSEDASKPLPPKAGHVLEED